MMRIQTFGKALLLLGLGAGLCGPASAGDDTEMIVDGTPAPDGKYPYQIRMYKSANDDKGSCGGSLIADQWVLTAAHCLYAPILDPVTKSWNMTTKRPLGLAEVWIGYGSTDRRQNTKVESAGLFIHPDYLRCEGDIECSDAAKADIALIKLKEPIADAPAVPIADPEREGTLLVPGAKVVVTGWGAMWNPYDEDVLQLLAQFGPAQEMTEKMNYPIKLHEVEVDWVDNASCSAAFDASGEGATIADREICAMRMGTRKDSCQGDSGGPLVVPGAGPQDYVQVGVVSWGRGCGSSTPGVYARVSAFSDWIRDTMSGAAVSTAPEPEAGGAGARAD